MIFDCCHAADGTRRRNAGARFIWGMDLCPLPADIDSEITNNSPISTRILVAEEEISIQAMRSHVLLAACGHMEQAYEDQLPPNYPGFFTRALLDLLRSRGADKLTYKGCIQRFPKLLTPRYVLALTYIPSTCTYLGWMIFYQVSKPRMRRHQRGSYLFQCDGPRSG